MKETSERFLPFRRASSGLNSTATDMANWLAAVTQEGFLPRTARDTMWTPVRFNDGKPGQWGIGWQVYTRGTHRAVAMTGGGRAAVYYYPENHVGVVILTNLTGSFPEDMVDKVASLYAPELKLSGVAALRIALEERGYARASQEARTIETANPGMAWSEMELNDWGYRLLSTGRVRDAIPLFAFIVGKYPDSINAHDSLAQAYHVAGDPTASLREYELILKLNPNNSDARRHIGELGGSRSQK